MELTTITCDKQFLSFAVTTILQLQEQLGTNESINVVEMVIDEDSGHLVLFSEKKKELVN